MKVPGEDKGGLVFPSLSLPPHSQTEALDSIHRKTRGYCKDGMFWVDECSNETMTVNSSDKNTPGTLLSTCLASFNC